MQYGLLVLWLLLCPVTPALAQMSIGIALPGVSIGIDLPVFPELVRVPGYPVYYAPRLDSNFFFYDGMYWVYQEEVWYTSSWYNGPWGRVAPELVPLFVLRIPVRYYRAPPASFRGWQPEAPPRWGEHWGHAWEQHRSGWSNWNRHAAPAPAPLPVYQRRYTGDHYPDGPRQQALQQRNYHYQPRDTTVRQHQPERAVQRATPPAQPQRGVPPERSAVQQDIQHSRPSQPPPQHAPAIPHAQPPQRWSEELPGRSPHDAEPRQRGATDQSPLRQPQQGPAPRERQAPSPGRADSPGREDIQHGRGASQEPVHGGGQTREHDRGEQRGGQERNR